MRFIQFLLLEAREDYVAQQMGDKLSTRYTQDTGNKLSPLEIAKKLSGAGPKYIQWIAKQYVNGQFKIEDLERLKQDLSEFERVKNKLEVKDINKYKDLRQLYTALKPFENVEIVSNTKASQNIKQSGADKIFEDKDGTVYRLKTQEAACLLGRGTKWCTAATKGDNYFQYYNEKGPLFVIIMKDTNEKYQFHFESEQFMDSDDQEIDIDEFAYNYPDIIDAIVLNHPQGLGDNEEVAGKLMPYLSEKTQLAVVKLDPRAILGIERESRSKELCMTALHKDWTMYRYVPDKFKTLALSYEVVQHIQKQVSVWGEYIPKEHFAPIKQHFQNLRDLKSLERMYKDDVDVLKILTKQETKDQSKTEEAKQYLQELITSYNEKIEDYKLKMQPIKEKIKQFEKQTT